jgi:cytochrome c biogenesis protein CcdA
MNPRQNWLEPLIRVVLGVGVGAFSAGILLQVVWLQMIGGCLLEIILLAAAAAGVYLLVVGRAKPQAPGD